MLCPECGHPMEKGRLYGNEAAKRMAWMPEGKKLRELSREDVEAEGGFLLGMDELHLEGCLLKTWICRRCGMGMFGFTER